jgi:hypothetical protein
MPPVSEAQLNISHQLAIREDVNLSKFLRQVIPNPIHHYHRKLSPYQDYQVAVISEE